MTDTPVEKSLLHSARDLIQAGLHLILIPIVALLKGLVALLTHLLAEAEKI